jgi:hypothetical protein
VLLQTCFHLQNFNEFLVIEGFINKTFNKNTDGNDMYCLLDNDEKGPAEVATDLFRSIPTIQADKLRLLESKRSTDVQMRDISLPFDRARVKYTAGPTQPLEMKDNSNMILDPEEIAASALRRDTEFKICKASD